MVLEISVNLVRNIKFHEKFAIPYTIIHVNLVFLSKIFVQGRLNYLDISSQEPVVRKVGYYTLYVLLEVGIADNVFLHKKPTEF